jgi:hypothetical protein
MTAAELEGAKQYLLEDSKAWNVSALRQWLLHYCYMDNVQANSVIATFRTPANVIKAGLKLYDATVLPRETSTGRDAERVFTDALDLSKNEMAPDTIGLLVSGFILLDEARSSRASFVFAERMR